MRFSLLLLHPCAIWCGYKPFDLAPTSIGPAIRNKVLTTELLLALFLFVLVCPFLYGIKP